MLYFAVYKDNMPATDWVCVWCQNWAKQHMNDWKWKTGLESELLVYLKATVEILAMKKSEQREASKLNCPNFEDTNIRIHHPLARNISILSLKGIHPWNVEQLPKGTRLPAYNPGRTRCGILKSLCFPKRIYHRIMGTDRYERKQCSCNWKLILNNLRTYQYKPVDGMFPNLGRDVDNSLNSRFPSKKCCPSHVPRICLYSPLSHVKPHSSFTM